MVRLDSDLMDHRSDTKNRCDYRLSIIRRRPEKSIRSPARGSDVKMPSTALSAVHTERQFDIIRRKLVSCFIGLTDSKGAELKREKFIAVTLSDET